LRWWLCNDAYLSRHTYSFFFFSLELSSIGTEDGVKKLLTELLQHVGWRSDGKDMHVDNEKQWHAIFDLSKSSLPQEKFEQFLIKLYKLGTSDAADCIFKAVEAGKLYLQFTADRVLGMDSELNCIVVALIERMLEACGVADLNLPHGTVIVDKSPVVSCWVSKMMKGTLIMIGGQGLGTGWHLDWESAFNILVQVLKERSVSNEPSLSPPTAMSTWATMGVHPEGEDKRVMVYKIKHKL